MRLALPLLIALSLPACGDKDGADTAAPDADGDGFPAGLDCDDTAPGVHPGAVEVCDGVDNDCDGRLDGRWAADAPVWFVDLDGDGYGDALYPRATCEAPEGHVDNADDCDDSDDDVHPDGAETCNGVDDDCDGEVDEGEDGAPTWYRDADEDGYGDPGDTARACEAPDGYVASATDCDDGDPAISPGAAETWYDGVDADCDGGSDFDQDGDGLDAAGFGGDDCDDTDASVRPGATEHCDGVDEDCNGLVDDDPIVSPTYFRDADGDGQGVPDDRMRACEPPEGYADNALDCDDTDAAIYDGAPETWYDGVDTDCDGGSDFDQDGDGYDSDAFGGDDCDDTDAATFPTTWFQDGDGDGYGDAGSTLSTCAAPSGYVLDSTDCDDGLASVNPGGAEVCGDGLDNDCDGLATGCGLMGSLGLADARAELRGDSTNDEAGEAVCIPGDIDGDGALDLLVGASADAAGGAGGGSAYLVLGTPSGTGRLDGGEAVISGAAGEAAGQALAGLPDVNGDGYDELVVGAADAAWIFHGPLSGALGSADAAAVLLAPTTGGLAGGALAGAELSGDGVADLAAWAPGDGAVYLVGGAASGGLDLDAGFAAITGLAPGTGAVSLAGAGDVDGDGQDDLLVGAAGHDGGRGRAWLLSGPLSGSLGATDAVAWWSGSRTYAELGAALAPAGDVDGDGYDDILVGAPGDTTGGTGAGAAWLVLGPASGAASLGSAHATLVGAAGDGAGASVAAGDVDGDGTPDLLVGAPDAGPGGQLFIVVGPVSGSVSLSSADGVIASPHSRDELGAALATGDVDGDGHDDILVGAPLYNQPSINAGAAFLLMGGPGL